MLKLEKFAEKDIDVLSPIMKRAFDEDSRISLQGQAGGPPGYDDGSFLRKWFLSSKATAFVIELDDYPIGGVNLFINPDGSNFLGCLFIDPKYENKGYGKMVWEQVESLFPDTKEWRTETPIFSHRNHNFYINKCGFSCVHIINPRDVNEGQFELRKIMK